MTSADRVLKQLRVRLAAGAVVPFVGAGVSRAVEVNSGGGRAFPSWGELLDGLAQDLEAREKTKPAALVKAHLMAPPDYLLAAKVATEHTDPDRWSEFLKNRIDVPRDSVNPASLALARAIWSLSPFVITTNYDRVMSWAGADELKVEPRVVNIQDSKEVLLEAIGQTLAHPTVWHVHGHVDDPEHIVLAPESYDTVYDAALKGQSQFEAARSVLRMILAIRSLLFIGFSLDDPYFSEQVRAIQQVFDGKGGPHFVLLKRDDIARKREQLEALGVLPVAYEDHGEPLVQAIRKLAQAARPAAWGADLRDEAESGGIPLDDHQFATAAQYLARDLPIGEHDKIADRMRAHATTMIYDPESIRNAAIDTDPAHRVAAYVALQMRTYGRLSEMFSAALHREVAEAATRAETRPLWQLLLAIEFAVESQSIDVTSVAALTASVSSSLAVFERLAEGGSVDPGGECRARLLELSDTLARAASQDMSFAVAKRLLDEFAARNALRVGSPSGPVFSASGARAFCAEENDGVGMVYCYATGHRKGAVAWVRKGIAWYYRQNPDLAKHLGLPLGREETMVGGSFSRFERGFIEWSSTGSMARAYSGPYPDRSRLIGKPARI